MSPTRFSISWLGIFRARPGDLWEAHDERQAAGVLQRDNADPLCPQSYQYEKVWQDYVIASTAISNDRMISIISCRKDSVKKGWRGPRRNIMIKYTEKQIGELDKFYKHPRNLVDLFEDTVKNGWSKRHWNETLKPNSMNGSPTNGWPKE